MFALSRRSAFELIEQRLGQRRDHFAGPTLLASQFVGARAAGVDEDAACGLPIDWTT